VTQTAPTMLSNAETSVESMESLALRVELQERWRRNVEQITELAIRFHSSDCSPAPDQGSDDVRDIADRLASARTRLREVEDAMRRLDVASSQIGETA
jgi:hypothetical protein